MAEVDSLAAFRAEARESGVPEAEIERWIAEFALPCALLYLPEQAPEGAPVVGTAGGRPLLPVQAWPPGLPLLVSVDLAAIPRDAIGLPLPEDGRLLLFGDLRENKSTFMSYSPHQLIYVPVGTEVSVRPPPPGEDRHGPFPFDEAELRLVVDWSLPNRGVAGEEYPHGVELGRAWGDDDYTSGGPPALLQIGGHPWVTGTDPLPDADWVLLAWIGFGDDYFVNDRYLTRWVIRREDLAARRFDLAQPSLDPVEKFVICQLGLFSTEPLSPPIIW